MSSSPVPLRSAAPDETRRPGLGLALSGGGFRASFFHVGVLARLAETGTLRQVEVISTVSGGSILGALYYLAVKDLLESVPDGEITDDHYVQVVQRVEQTLFEGVATQVRARTYSDLGKNLRMRHEDYSRSDRIGELYDEIFYRPVWNESQFGGRTTPRGTDDPIQMRELLIHPPGETDAFRPLRHNDRRSAPVPVLLLNATSLNTGHSWRFQAVEMGEDPRKSDDWVQIDKNKRLLSQPYETIATHQQDFPLGAAVGASACVPALFHPLAVSGLFPDGIRVQLVDGGVHDNQGVSALFDLGCRRMIVSDASGQMGDIDEPSTRIPAAAGRASSIYGDRVREEQLVELLERPDTSLLHLRKGLPAIGVSPLGPGDRPLAEESKRGVVDYEVDAKVQLQLSKVRTDLDSFSEVEAYSLSLYAYLMAKHDLPDTQSLVYPWNLETADLAALRSELRKPRPAYSKQLDVAAKRFLKASSLNATRRLMKWVVIALLVAALIGLVWVLRGPLGADIPAAWLIAAIAIPAVLVGLYTAQKFPVPWLYDVSDKLYTWLLPALMAPVLWFAAKVMLGSSKAFLKEGRIAKVAAKDGVV